MLRARSDSYTVCPPTATDNGPRTTDHMPDDYSSISDRDLLAQCDVDTYRASGPGGQHRNKTDSAVRLRHRPTGMLVIAEERRSQHQNKANALKRLREALAVKVRAPVDRLPVYPPRGVKGRLGKKSRAKIGP